MWNTKESKKKDLLYLMILGALFEVRKVTEYPGLPRENQVEGSEASGDLNWSALKSHYQLDGSELEVDPD